jgi:C4-dicarboxylate-specific signal transduction histidine kinase
LTLVDVIGGGDEAMKSREFDVQDELAHASRIAAVEHLSASIVHEVAQPVSAVLINAQTALRRGGGRGPDL